MVKTQKKHVDKLTPSEIRRLFPDQEFSEAAGVLGMISKTPEQLLADNARLKFHRDEAARMEQATLEGEARGREIGRISLLQELLGQRIWSAEEFAACDTVQLNAMADQLQQQLRTRNS